MQTQEHPYSGGWPRWPFGQLSESHMADLLHKLEQQRWEEVQELLEVEALL